MGAATFNRGAFGVFGGAGLGPTDDVYKNLRIVRGTLTLSASYATGGDSLSLANTGLERVLFILIDPNRGLNGSGLSLALDAASPQAPKVLAYDADATEVANATNLSGRVPFPVWLLGK